MTLAMTSADADLSILESWSSALATGHQSAAVVDGLLDHRYKEKPWTFSWSTDEGPDAVLGAADVARDPQSVFMRQLKAFSVLDASEERRLAQAMEAGVLARAQLAGTLRLARRAMNPEELRAIEAEGRRAYLTFFQSNLRLVLSIARRYMHSGMELMDLFQEGAIALDRAVKKFDYRLGYKFSTYATWWIRQGISRAVADQSRLIRLPVHYYEVVSRVRAEVRARRAVGACTDLESLAEHLEMTPLEVRAALSSSSDCWSIHEPVPSGDYGLREYWLSGDGEVELQYLLVSPDGEGIESDGLEEQALRDFVRMVLETLSEREAAVIAMRFGLDDGNVKTLEEVGALFGVTRERIRQIQTTALKKIEHPSRSQLLRPYW